MVASFWKQLLMQSSRLTYILLLFGKKGCTFALFFFIWMHFYASGCKRAYEVGIAQLVKRQTRDRKIASSIPAGTAEEFSSPVLTFYADSSYSM